MDAKLKISITDGILEVEGSESFLFLKYIMILRTNSKLSLYQRNSQTFREKPVHS